LCRHFFPFGLRDIGIEEYVSIPLVQGQGVDVDYLLLVDKFKITWIWGPMTATASKPNVPSKVRLGS
jgi:hypothetical protein